MNINQYFPCVREYVTNTQEQFNTKLLEEMAEVTRAKVEDNPENLKEELCDIMQIYHSWCYSNNIEPVDLFKVNLSQMGFDEAWIDIVGFYNNHIAYDFIDGIKLSYLYVRAYDMLASMCSDNEMLKALIMHKDKIKGYCILNDWDVID